MKRPISPPLIRCLPSICRSANWSSRSAGGYRASPPRLTVYDNGEGLAEIAVERLRSWGYQDVALLAEGLAGWRRSGGELFQDVNSASKAFGELVESVRHTPSLSAQEVQALIDQPAGGGDRRRPALR